MRMYSSHLEDEQVCRMFCRSIHTGKGEVTVRPISPADAELMQAFVTGLSGTSRYLRFFQALKSLSPGMLDHLTRVDQVKHVALAGVANLDGRPSIFAEARYAVNSGEGSAEIALAVADQWQRCGIATELLTTLERIAAVAGITRLTGECLAFNEPFVCLVRTLGYRVIPDASDCRLLQIEKYIDGGKQSRGTNFANIRGRHAAAIEATMGW
jgi:acetyltransferase